MADDSDNTPKLKVLKPLIEFKGAVLDLDGTLLDAEPLYFEAYQHAANSYVHLLSLHKTYERLSLIKPHNKLVADLERSTL